MDKTTRFDAADYLDTEKRQAAYIAAAIAKKAGLNRESLYKALGKNGNPEFATVMRIVRSLGPTLSARAALPSRSAKRRRVA
jgi:DNA-binding phage protein